MLFRMLFRWGTSGWSTCDPDLTSSVWICLAYLNGSECMRMSLACPGEHDATIHSGPLWMRRILEIGSREKKLYKTDQSHPTYPEQIPQPRN